MDKEIIVKRMVKSIKYLLLLPIEYPNSKDQELMDSFEVRKNSGFHSSKCRKTKAGWGTVNDILQPPQFGKRQIQKRNFVTGGGRWPHGVVRYKIKPGDFSESGIRVIKDAMQEISDKTCITFQEEVFSKTINWNGYTLPYDVYSKSFILFVDFWDSKQYTNLFCGSLVGRFGKLQVISLADPTCLVHGIAMHEILHALGMIHEQQRPDRDLNIKVLWENIHRGNRNSFGIEQNAETRSPFDISSIMQYPLQMGSKYRGRNAVEPLYNRLGFLAGNTKYLTFYDAKKINQEYCTGKCYGYPTICQNEGYLDHRCLCSCPRGLTGSNCNLVDSDNDCGGVIDVSNGAKFITTPRYPSRYPLWKKCTWLIKTFHGRRLRLELIDMDLPYSGSTNNCYHWLEVKSHLLGQTGLRICGNYDNNMMETTPHGVKNRMLLIFDSHTSKWPGNGLKMRVSTI